MENRTPHLSDGEVQTIRAALARRRRPGSYEPGRWSVSAYNRDGAVLGAPFPNEYPENVVIRDITLRVIEQTPGVVLDSLQRKRLGRSLVEAGIGSVEVPPRGWGISIDDVREQISELKSMRSELEVKIGQIQSIEMVDLAARAGATLAEVGMASLPELGPIYWSEAYRVAWQGGDWRRFGVPTNLEEAIAIGTDLIMRIKSHGLIASAGINLLTLVDDEHIRNYCTAMVQAGADEIWLSDGPSGLGPEAWNHVISTVKKFAPTQRIAVYARNAFGMAVGNAVAAVHAGANTIEVSINGISAAAGQVDMAQFATAVEVLYGVNTGVALEKMTELARLVEDISGIPIPVNHAVTGRGAHNWGGTELVVQELKVDPLVHYPIDPALVGGRRNWIVNRMSGMWTVKDKLEELSLGCERPIIESVWVGIVSEMAVRRRELTDDEIRALARNLGATNR